MLFADAKALINTKMSSEEDSVGSVAPFAHNPAEAIHGIVNYRQREGSKLYYRGVERLDPKELFSCDSVW